MRNIRSIAGMLDGHGADIPLGIQFKQRVFIEIPRFRNFSGPKLDVKRISVLKIFDFQGVKPRSKNAL